MKTINKNEIYEGIQKTISDYTDLFLPLEDVKTVMEYLEEENQEFWEDEYKHQSWSDTLPRDYIFDSIAKNFIDKYPNWPINADSPEYSDGFFKELDRVARKRNWRPTD